MWNNNNNIKVLGWWSVQIEAVSPTTETITPPTDVHPPSDLICEMDTKLIMMIIIMRHEYIHRTSICLGRSIIIITIFRGRLIIIIMLIGISWRWDPTPSWQSGLLQFPILHLLSLSISFSNGQHLLVHLMIVILILRSHEKLPLC